MSDLAQVEDNIQTFSDGRLLSEQELSLVRQVSDVIHGLYAVPCTSCRYCCAGCPQQLDIPFLLAAYNEYKTGGEKELSSWRLARLGALPEAKRPSACIGCGVCTAHCPQGLDVPAYMKEMASFHAALDCWILDRNYQIAGDKGLAQVLIPSLIERGIQVIWAPNISSRSAGRQTKETPVSSTTIQRYLGRSIDRSFPHACRIRKVCSTGPTLRSQRYLPLLEGDLIRAVGWTAIPFPLQVFA